MFGITVQFLLLTSLPLQITHSAAGCRLHCMYSAGLHSLSSFSLARFYSQVWQPLQTNMPAHKEVNAGDWEKDVWRGSISHRFCSLTSSLPACDHSTLVTLCNLCSGDAALEAPHFLTSFHFNTLPIFNFSSTAWFSLVAHLTPAIPLTFVIFLSQMVKSKLRTCFT